MSFMKAIGLVTEVLGIISFFQDNLPARSPKGATIRIKVGLEDNSANNYGGRIAQIMAYDTNNAVIGNLRPNKDIASGDFADYTIDQETPGIQSRYVSFLGTNGAICISWITLKNLDGALDAAWTGDVGSRCGHGWNWGRQVAGRDAAGNPYIPRCTWIDADHSNGLDTGAIKIDFQAYGDQLQDTIKNNAACSKTIFQSKANQVDGIKRSMIEEERPEWMTKRLIVSDFPTHNATELCLHPMSFGPDAVGSDGYFCNMKTRELTPLCTFKDVEGCIDVDQTNSKISKRSSVAKRSASLHVRSYEQVDEYRFIEAQ
ncbi:hypothetical protein DM02DRAFT_581396 [Periconia macrospinosa]|uniref:Uncharacterized protein n=1 Tax=Periconia macrospinosa TaxID=97972 RepID=A0A2V1EC94_9PLEO|nr:hypothetical protein DM02DRAFT_581396 [Periconia macrospinosa]